MNRFLFFAIAMVLFNKELHAETSRKIADRWVKQKNSELPLVVKGYFEKWHKLTSKERKEARAVSSPGSVSEPDLRDAFKYGVPTKNKSEFEDVDVELSHLYLIRDRGLNFLVANYEDLNEENNSADFLYMLMNGKFSPFFGSSGTSVGIFELGKKSPAFFEFIFSNGLGVDHRYLAVLKKEFPDKPVMSKENPRFLDYGSYFHNVADLSVWGEGGSSYFDFDNDGMGEIILSTKTDEDGLNTELKKAEDPDAYIPSLRMEKILKWDFPKEVFVEIGCYYKISDEP